MHKTSKREIETLKEEIYPFLQFLGLSMIMQKLGAK